jgi:hypothetical protein
MDVRPPRPAARISLHGSLSSIQLIEGGYMHITPVVLAVCLLGVPSLATGGARCCDKDKGCEMKECAMSDGGSIASEVLLPQGVINAAPVRQSLVVLFQRPTKVGDRILLGRYIVEHDNDRMARGEPCTHLYNASDPRLPVVRFHCTHLTRPRTDKNVVELRSLGDQSGTQAMTAFTFGGETAGHGVPTGR